MNKTMNELKHHYSFTLQPEDSGQRLDKWLQLQLPDMTRSAVQKLIEQGNVTRNGIVVSKNGKGNFIFIKGAADEPGGPGRAGNYHGSGILSS
mgnify:CR=1 FL=1